MSGKKMVRPWLQRSKEWDTHQIEVGLAQKKDNDQNTACNA